MRCMTSKQLMLFLQIKKQFKNRKMQLSIHALYACQTIYAAHAN